MWSGQATRRRKLFARARYHECKIIIDFVVVCLRRSNVTCVPLGYAERESETARMSDSSAFGRMCQNALNHRSRRTTTTTSRHCPVNGEHINLLENLVEHDRFFFFFFSIRPSSHAISRETDCQRENATRTWVVKQMEVTRPRARAINVTRVCSRRREQRSPAMMNNDACFSKLLFVLRHGGLGIRPSLLSIN